ncbi:hypothetical protein ANCDUO_02350 [Ancylostoma duodenale]|uniref:Uncharacterized protein n=1 Tax=Ancylostoma duodenale TaxID=51022 RepID=A0A0C2HCN6_9BILA|nr:hypothetical protein ANCDUO_02350 [Ancylostoma duodenale]
MYNVVDIPVNSKKLGLLFCSVQPDLDGDIRREIATIADTVFMWFRSQTDAEDWGIFELFGRKVSGVCNAATSSRILIGIDDKVCPLTIL